MDNNHPWYLVTVVLKVMFATPNNRLQYQEQCRLVKAADATAARKKAAAMVTSEGAAVVSKLALGIHWQLDSIAAVIPLADLWDGAEVCTYQRPTQNVRHCLPQIEFVET